LKETIRNKISRCRSNQGTGRDIMLGLNTSIAFFEAKQGLEATEAKTPGTVELS